MKASDLFLRCLEEQGVDTIFGVPGEENADIMISLLNSSIEFVTCRHEQAAAFMADMHGRLTGRPGVCLATLGPGATNLITGVANANMDHAPVVAIIGQASTSRLHKESHQNMPAIQMYTPVTKWATSVREAAVIPEVIAKAFKLAISSKPGATVIELPEDIAGQTVELKPLPQACVDYEMGVDVRHVDQAVNLLAKSNKVIMLLGAGAARAKCDEEVTQFVAHTGVFAANTFMGKGVMPARSMQSLFCVGLGMKDIALEAFDQADLVICVGYDMVEWSPSRWNANGDKKIIHIDTLPAEVDEDYLPNVELVGEIRGILQSINTALGNEHKKDPKLFSAIRQRAYDDLTEYDNDTAFPIKPQRILHDVREVMADNDILISDVGAHKMWVARQYFTYQSGSCFIYNGFCSMGGSMPGAFAAKRLYPKRNVVALCGDGGFIMSIQALVSAVQYNVPITVLLWQDDCYGLIKWKQEAVYQETSHVNLVNPDLKTLAEAFGAHGVHINAVDELKPALQESFARKDKPTVIIVPVDYAENMKLTERLGEIVSR